MREENLKTYYIWLNGNSESLIYDFSLVIGDTFRYGNTVLYVLQDDYVLINNVLKKRLIFSPSPQGEFMVDTIIENIGCLRGITYPYGYGSIGAYHELLCYSQNGELIYQNPRRSRCYYDKVEDINE